jgi:dynein heavy chain
VPASPEEVLDKKDELEHALEEWTAAIKEMLVTESAKKVEVQNSAMAEINFWRNRSATLSAFHQKFSLPQVKKILEMIELARNSYQTHDFIAYDNFSTEMGKLNKFYAEAKDNEKFLLTLERQFNNIQKDDLDLIEETLASLMNGLRLVWTISRHYKDEKMLNLMSCIANEIADRVES